MKDLPSAERPYEKCMDKGAVSLSDSELLSVILRSGSHGESALDLARRILYDPAVGPSEGLARLKLIHTKEWMKMRGIGPVKAAQLACVSELTRRMSLSTGPERLLMSSPSFVAENYMEELRYQGQEVVKLIFLDTKSKWLGECDISKGTVNASLISPREIYHEALRFGAVFIVLLHNHPSGDPTPSQADFNLTDKLERTGEIIGIPLMDHIVIGDGCYYSFQEHGVLRRFRSAFD